MSKSRDRNARLRRSWVANADAWTRVVRSGGVRSREAVTNAAVLDAVGALAPTSVLDVGCGEGWLVHALAPEAREVVGVDGSEALIRAAREGQGRFHVATYDRIARDPTVAPGPFDAVICNFSLLNDDLQPLLVALRARLARPAGRLVIQTVHPLGAWTDGAYRDGWREETFNAFDESFREPMPWYFRTLSSWTDELQRAGFVLTRLAEPRASADDPPASLLLVAGPA